jgi:UDP-glucose 6-dehydrogenase
MKPKLKIVQFGIGEVGHYLLRGLGDMVVRSEVPAEIVGCDPVGWRREAAEEHGFRAIHPDRVEEYCDHDAFIFVLPTPRQSNGSNDLGLGYDLTIYREALRSFATDVLAGADQQPLVVFRSTVPIGFAEKATTLLEEWSGRIHGEDFFVVSMPEFQYVIGRTDEQKFAQARAPQHFVLGANSDEARQRAHALYGALGVPIIDLSTSGAEAVKLLSNTFAVVKARMFDEFHAGLSAMGFDETDRAETMQALSLIAPSLVRPASYTLGGVIAKKTIREEGEKHVTDTHHLSSEDMDAILAMQHGGRASGGPCHRKDAIALLELFVHAQAHVPLLLATVGLNLRLLTFTESEKLTFRDHRLVHFFEENMQLHTILEQLRNEFATSKQLVTDMDEQTADRAR